MTYPTKCPSCGQDLGEGSDGFVTDELIAGTASGIINEDGEIEWSGSTEVAWDSSETQQVRCANCEHVLDEPTLPKPIEDVDHEASGFAAILAWCEQEGGAPLFAGDLAFFGTEPRSLREMARRWREGQFEPVAFADVLDESADAVATWRAEK